MSRKTLEDMVAKMTDEDALDFVARAQRTDAAEAAARAALERVRGARIDRASAGRSMKRAMLARVGRKASEAERQNRGRWTPEGDAVVHVLALIVGELAAMEPVVDVEDVVEDAERG